jgi:hypothetical protein
MKTSFLPDRLRPAAQRRRSRRPLIGLVILPAMLAMLPMWRVQAVDLSRCTGLPEEAVISLRELVGRPTIAVSPQWVRHQLEIWPEVSMVEVSLELPATLRVAAENTVALGSVPIGRRWHAVARDGSVAGALDAPLEPVLEGVECRPAAVCQALAVARRIRDASGAHVELVREITPADYLVRVRTGADNRSIQMHVRPEATAGEEYWCRRLAAGEAPASWVDLRWDDRVVLGGAG